MTMTVYKTIIKITIMYSIGTAPFRGQDLAAYRLRFTLFRQHYTIILLLLQAYYYYYREDNYYYYREDQSRIERAAITPTNHSRSSRDAGVPAC